MNNNEDNKGLNLFELGTGGGSCSCNSCQGVGGGSCPCNPCHSPCGDCERILLCILKYIKNREDCDCDTIIHLLRRILNKIGNCEPGTDCCEEILEKLDIIIEILINGLSNGSCICDSDNDSYNNTVMGSSSFMITGEGTRKVTAITASYNSTSGNIDSMTLTLTGDGGNVYSQQIPGAFSSGKIGTLTIAFTHPIVFEGPVTVTMTLEKKSLPDPTLDAYVSVNVASCLDDTTP